MRKSMKQKFFTMVWELSEWSGILLGKFAPYVFERMCGLENSKRVQVLPSEGNVTRVKIRKAKK